MDDDNQRLLAALQKQNVELQQQVAALQRSHHLLHAVVEGISDAVFVKDSHGRYLLANAAALKFAGKSIDEVLGHDDTLLFSAESAQQIRERDRRIMESGQTQTDEVVGTAAGQTRTYLSTKGPYRDDQGHVIGLIGISRDVTEQKRLAAALAGNEARFRAIVERGGDAFFLMDANGTVIFDTPPTAHNLGYSELENLGRSAFELVHPNDQLAVRSLFVALLQKPNTDVRWQFQALHRNGSWRWIDVIACNRLSDPNLQGIVVSYRDITERKTAEAALLASEQRFRALIEHSFEAISLVDQDGILLYGSPSATRLTGRSAEDYLGKSAFEQVHPDDLPQVRSLFAQLLSNPEQTQRLQFRFRHKDESWIWLEATGTNLLNQPAVQAIVINYRDITERRRAENEGQRFGRILDDSLNEIYLFDAISLCFVRVNSGARRNLGYTMEELCRMTPLDLKPEFSRHSFAALVEPLRTGQRPRIVFETVHRRKNGSTYPVEVHLQLANANESPLFIAIIQDITERQRAEAALRESQLALEHIVHSVDGIVWEADARTFQFSFVSQQAERLLGYPVERWLTEPTFWRDHLHPHDRDAAVEFCVSATREGKSHQFEYRMLSADGREVWLKDLVTVVLQDGELVKLRGIMVDITEHKRAESALIASEQRFRELFENSRDAIFVEDAIGQVRDVNPAACRLHGLTREQLLSQNARDLVPPDQRAIIDRDFPKLLSGELTQIEGFSLHADGTAVPVELSVSRVVHSGQPSLLLHARDITARKRAEQAVRDNEARLMGLINAAMDAIITIDENQNVVLFNPAAETIFQCSRAEVIGKSIHQFVPERFLATHDQQVRQFANSGSAVRQMGERSQVTGLRRDGSEFPAEASILKVQVGDRPFFTVLLRDITERQKAEQALRVSEGRLRLLVQASNIGFWDWNLLTNDAFLSPEWKQQLGYADHEVANRYEEWESRLHPEDRDRALAAVSDFRAGRRSDYDIEFRLRHKDGSWRWIMTRGDIIRDSDGRPIRMMGCHVDITDRKLVEEALRTSERKFAMLFHNSPVAFGLTTLAEGRIIDANAAYCELLGYERDELIGRSTLELNLVDVNERAEHAQVLERGGQLLGVETQYRHRSGKICDVLVSAERLDLEGDPLILGISLDITDRKRAERALSEKEQLLSESQRIAHIGSWTVTFDGRVAWSDETYRLYGVSPDSFTPTTESLLELLHPDDRAAMRAWFDACSAGLQPGALEVRAVLPDGSVRHLSGRGEMRFDSENRPLDMTGTVQDITDRKLAEFAVRASEERFRALVENSFDAISLIGPDGTIRFVTPPATRILGYSTDEYLQLKSLDLIHPEDVSQARRKLAWVAERPGQSVTNLHRMRHRDGSWRWIEGTGTNLFDDPVLNGIVINFRDVTERKRAEDELARQQAELQTILDAVPALIFYKDRDSRFVRVNRQLAQVVGWPAESFVGKTDADLGSEFSEQYRADDLRVLNSGQATHHREERLATTTGDRWLLSDKVPYRDEHGQIIGLIGMSVDITERKLAEAALRDSELRFRTLVDQAADALFVHDFRGQFLDINRSACESLGYSREELLSLSVADVVAGVPMDELLLVWDQLKPDQPLTIVGRHRRKDGSEFPAEVRLGLIDGDGVRVVLAIVRDITERVKAEEALAAERLLLRTMADNLPAYVFVKDTAGKYLFVNRTHARQLGMNSEADLLGKTAFDIFPQPIAQSYAMDDETVIQTGQPVIEQEERFEVNGHRGWFLTTKVPLRDVNDRVTGLVGIALDITARKQAEAALVNERNLLRTLVDHIPDYIFVKDTQSRQLLNNAANLRLIGTQTDAEMLGKTVFDIYPREQAQRYFDEDQRVMRSGQALLNQEESVLDQDGQEHWLLSTKIPLRDVHGKCIGLVGIKRDITELKRTNNELARSRKRLEILSRQLIATQESERRHLARELHDEIGQSLTGIKLNLRALQQPTPVARGETLVHDTIAVVDQTLQQVRSLALDLRPSLLDEIGLVAALRWCLDRQSQRAGFAPQFVADSTVSGASPEINTACFRIAQESLTNIARHAQARYVRVELRQDDRELELLVRDDGVGFDVPAARSRTAHGESLGLLGMEERVQLIGGQIEIVSLPSQGTTILVRIPLAGDSS